MKPYGLVCPFFGNLPPFFPYFLDSCRRMSGVDILIITDSTPPVLDYPPNVRIHPMTFLEYKLITEQELGIELRIDCPYKLVDHKPMWGAVFSELLKEYDYWGFCDIDQIFSREMFEFLEVGRKKGVDIINTHSIWTHGPLFLFKNTHEFRNFFRKSRDWQRALQNHEVTGFDECGKKHNAIAAMLGAPRLYCLDSRSFLDFTESQLLEIEDFQCLTSLVAREYHLGRCTVHQACLAKEALLPKEILYIDQQGIRDNGGVSWGAFHWVHDKKRRKFQYPNWKKLPPRVYVTQYGFFNSDTPLANRFIWLYRFFRGGFKFLSDLCFGRVH